MLVDFNAQDTSQTAGETIDSSETGTQTPPAPGLQWVPLVLVFGIFYFLLIRPERKRRRQNDQMLEALKKGDEVMTNGGMYARVVQIQDEKVTLEIAEGVRVKYSRAAIQSILGDDDSKAS